LKHGDGQGNLKSFLPPDSLIYIPFHSFKVSTRQNSSVLFQI